MGKSRNGQGVAAAALVVLATVMACGAAWADTGPTTPGDDKPGDVKQAAYFQVEASGGTLADQGNGKFLLTLQGVNANAALYTEKPQRAQSPTPVGDLIESWDKNGFTTTPPNAALVVVSGDGAGSGATYKLSNPQRSGDTLTFSAQAAPLQGNKLVAAPVQQAAASAKGTVPASFGRSTLFVDPVNDFMHYCFARIHNATRGNLAAAGVLLISPQYFPRTLLTPNSFTNAASLGPLICNIDYGFTGGGVTVGLNMTNPKGADNSVTCSSLGGRCRTKVTHDTATFNVEVEIEN